MSLVLTGDGRKNEGTGSAGRVEGSLERQDWKDGMTREIRSLKRLAIFLFFVLERNAASRHKLFVLQGFI